MNKSNKILLGVLAFVVVCVVGYALFSETITVTGTATAKGNLNLKMSEVSYFELWGANALKESHGIINNSNLVINDNTISTNVSLGAPDSYKRYLIKIENIGTVPVVFGGYENLSDSSIEEMDSFRFVKYSSDNKSSLDITISFEGNVYNDYEGIGGWFEQGLLPNDEPLSSSVLDPGESAYMEIDHCWSNNSTSQEVITMDFSLKLNWKQVTVN